MKQYSTRAQFKRKASLSKYARQRILERDANLCFYCEFEADQVDHIVPYSYGGTDDEDNLVACCGICNCIASNKIFETIAEKRTYVRSRYGPYLEVRWRRLRRKLSFCPDCQMVFAPNVEGATAVLCRSCSRDDLNTPRRLRPNKKQRIHNAELLVPWPKSLCSKNDAE